MTGYKRLLATVLAIAVVAVASTGTLIFTVPGASASSSVGHDPIGDAVSEAGTPPPGYLDMKQVKITEKKGAGVFDFSCVVAAPVPAALGPDDFAELCGLSLYSSRTGALKYVVIVRWNEGHYEGLLVDYSHGFPLSYTPIDFRIDDSKISAIVPAASLGNPDVLYWIALSREKHFVPSNPLEGVTDAVPDDVLELPWHPGDPQHPENLGVWTSKP